MSYSRRIIRGAVCLGWMLIPAALPAQTEAWSAFVEEWRQKPRAPLNLLASKELVTAAYRVSDDQIIRLTAGSDLLVEDMDGPFLDQVRAARDWDPEPHWILLDSEGKVLAEGRVPPPGAVLRDHLGAMGRTPAWEALERFLEQHPDHGEALQQRMALAIRMARLRLSSLRTQGLAESVRVSDDSRWPVLTQAKAKDPAAVAGLAREVGETLQKLNQIPDAWRGDWLLFSFWVDFQGSLDPGSFLPELGAFQEGIFEAWRRNPHAGGASRSGDGEGGLGLTDIWRACENLRDGHPRYADAFGLTPSPGRVWPSTDLLRTSAVNALMRGQAQDLLALLDGLEAEPSQRANWEEWLTSRQTACFWRTVALAQLERWPEAASAVQDLRRWAGNWWPRMAGTLKSLFGPVPEGQTAPVKPGGVPQAFVDLLLQPPLEPPPAPAVKPLRFLVWGHPSWAEHWKDIRQATPLADWGADELKDEMPTEADTAYLQRLGLAAAWAVFRGTAELVARGDGPPDPRTLALQLAAVAPARLQVLDAFIRQHPDHLDARRDRFALLRTRMPRPEYEGRLMEDEALAGISLDFGPDAPWIRNREGWRSRAQRALPDLEAALHRWPGNASLWRQWVGWSAFLPGRPSALALSGSLAIFGSRAEWKAKLPAAAHKAIAGEFLRKRRFNEMADWFMDAWKGVLARTLESSANPRLEARPQDAVIYESLGAALRPLGRAMDLRSLEQAWSKVRKPPEEEKP